MSIHTVANDKEEYFRVIGSDTTSHLKSHIGAYGIVTSRTDRSWSISQAANRNLVFGTIRGKSYVFNEEDIKYVTKKEYFLGALGG